MLIDKDAVLEILNRLLDQAQDCEAESGETPTAFEALDWAISEVKALVPASATSERARPV